jgi:hypothetical protein
MLMISLLKVSIRLVTISLFKSIPAQANVDNFLLIVINNFCRLLMVLIDIGKTGQGELGQLKNILTFRMLCKLSLIGNLDK